MPCVMKILKVRSRPLSLQTIHASYIGYVFFFSARPSTGSVHHLYALHSHTGSGAIVRKRDFRAAVCLCTRDGEADCCKMACQSFASDHRVSYNNTLRGIWHCDRVPPWELWKVQALDLIVLASELPTDLFLEFRFRFLHQVGSGLRCKALKQSLCCSKSLLKQTSNESTNLYRLEGAQYNIPRVFKLLSNAQTERKPPSLNEHEKMRVVDGGKSLKGQQWTDFKGDRLHTCYLGKNRCTSNANRLREKSTSPRIGRRCSNQHFKGLPRYRIQKS